MDAAAAAAAIAQIEEMDAECDRLRAEIAEGNRQLANMQAPSLQRLAQQQQQTNRSSAAAAATLPSASLFHAQLQLANGALGSPLASGTCSADVAEHQIAPAFATAAAAEAAGASASSSSSHPQHQSSTPPSMVHILLSNPTDATVETDPRYLSLVAELRVAAPLAAAFDSAASSSSAAADDQRSDSDSSPEDSSSHYSIDSFSWPCPFPDVRWGPRSSFQMCIPIDCSLIAAGWTDVIIRDWTLDAFDFITPVLQLPPLSNASSSSSAVGAVSAAARSISHTPGSVNAMHQQALQSGDSSRIFHPPVGSLFGSIYSTPAWYRQNLPAPAPAVSSTAVAADSPPLPLLDRILSDAQRGDNSSNSNSNASSTIQIAFAGPLMIGGGAAASTSSHERCSVVQWLIRIILTHLFPAYSLAFSDAAIGSLLNGLTGSFAPNVKAGATASVQFATNQPGCSTPMQWTVDYRVPSSHASATGSSSPPTLFVIRIRTPSPLHLPRVYSSIMQRLHKLLFARSIASAASSTALPSARSMLCPLLPHGWSSVQVRQAPSLAALVGSGASKDVHDAAAEAQRWFLAYVKATRAVPTVASGAAASSSPSQQHSNHHQSDAAASAASASKNQSQLASIISRFDSSVSVSDDDAADAESIAQLFALFYSTHTAQSSNHQLLLQAGTNGGEFAIVC